MTRPGTAAHPLRVAIVGAGPTGYYAAEALFRQPDLVVSVDLFDRLPTPYGLVQLSPDSVSGGDNGSGYNFEHTTLMGFSFTHMSGIGWYGDLGNFLVTPTTGPLKTSYGETNKPGTGYLSRKADEVAKAGYYAVTLADYGVRAELTAAPRAGMLRFTFPKSDQSRIQVDLARRVAGTAVVEAVKVVGDNAIEDAFKRFKDLADRKKDVYDEDIIALVDDEVVRHNDRIKFVALQVVAGSKGPQLADLIGCLERGYRFEARVTQVQGGLVRVLVAQPV